MARVGRGFTPGLGGLLWAGWGRFLVKRAEMGKDPDSGMGIAAGDVSQLKLRRVAVADLILDPANVRAHNERNLKAIEASLARFGQQKPIVIDRHRVVVAGNGTVLAARALGWSEVEAVATDLEGDEARAYAIADNRLSDLSDFDPIKLGAAVERMTDDLIAAIGFDSVELDELLTQDLDAPAAEGNAPGRKLGGSARPTVKLVLAIENVADFERALAETGQLNREEAVLVVVRSYLKSSAERQLHA